MMLDRDASKRPSADVALRHAWLLPKNGRQLGDRQLAVNVRTGMHAELKARDRLMCVPLHTSR
jgi:hypothetical protein